MRRKGSKNRKGVKLINNGCGYMRIRYSEHPNANAKGYVYEHVLIASRALGRPLPKGCEVHHVNGDGLDNRPENLIICDSLAYHKLIHRRTEAYYACGDPTYRKCQFCGVWSPEGSPGFYSPHKQAYHKACRLRALNLKDRRGITDGVVQVPSAV